VDGNLAMSWTAGGGLLGGMLGSINLSGVSEAATLKGLVYVTNDLSITQTCVIQGNVIAGGNISISSGISMSYDGWSYNYPPPGFSKGSIMRLLPGTWRRTVR
jgi:hypothetical protein